VPSELFEDCACIHSTYEAGCVPDDDCPRCYGTGEHLPSIYAVVLAAADEAQLERVASQLDQAEIPHVVIHEPDAPYCGAATAIGVLPVEDRRSTQRALRGLELLC
jgi:hypothetical protein